MKNTLPQLYAKKMLPGALAACCLGAVLVRAAPTRNSGAILDKQRLLEAQTFLDNRDWDWYKRNIPFFDSPDADINATYYYRWELLTKHLVYGSPTTGYTFTEFMDRPGWSGTYGAISCAAGHHLYEARWLKDPRIAQDYARYWFQTPGAAPRAYSAWLGDAVWATYKVQQDRPFVTQIRQDLIANYKGWVQEHYDPKVGLFWQTGMADGMETNINSRQTKDWFAGAQGYRPTLNSYLYADALAIKNISELAGDQPAAREYEHKAAELKAKMQTLLWDPKREFFLHTFRNDEQDGIKALSRTYETGKYAGSPHGREEIGFVPWEFDLPDKGHEAAWKFLMNPDYFFSEFGPTVTERHDPLFLISKNCCVWSGQSWPYATTQTLVAMANLLNDYKQTYVDKSDYFKLLQVYTRTQRKNGQPYIAESAHPDTGSWEGSDHFDHSEHYFHSGYNDLIITGLVGLRPRADDIVEVNPLAPASWDYFALDDVAYHGHSLSILWDRQGKRYGKGKGLLILMDGRRIASAPTLKRLTANMGVPSSAPDPPSPINYAVNNEGAYYPRLSASFTAPKTLLQKVNDGNYWYHASPPNRWSSQGSGSGTDWCQVDFGIARPINRVALYLLDDGPGSGIEAPERIELQSWNGRTWMPVPGQKATPSAPIGHRANEITFPEQRVQKLRAVFTHKKGASTGLSEFEAWGSGSLPLALPSAPVGNIAYNAAGTGFPKASASYTSPFDRVEEVNDGKVFFSANSRNRWTAYQSPHPTDWVAIDFGAAKPVRTIRLYLFGDGGGVRAPKNYTIQAWNGSDWGDVEEQSRVPTQPMAGAVNTVTIKPVQTSRIRVVFTHDRGSYAGLTEMEIESDDGLE